MKPKDVLNVSAPSPIRPGPVEFNVTGAVSLDIRGVGGQCDAIGEVVDFSADSNDVEGPGTEPHWFFYVRSEGPKPPRIVLQHGSELHSITYQAELAAESLRIVGHAVAFDAELRSEKGDTVRVKGRIEGERRATSNEVPEAVIDLLASVTKSAVRRHSTIDFGREVYPGAISAIVSKDQVQAQVGALRRRLGPGWVAFEGTNRSLAEDPPEGVELIVGPGETQFDILRIAKSDAVNYGMQTEAIVKKLTQYHEKYGIDIFHAETDTIEFKVFATHFDAAAFAEDLYAFCPDIVDQGLGSVEDLADALEGAGSVFLWWD